MNATPPTILPGSFCFCQGLKMCMRFGCNLGIIVCYLFRSLNFVNFLTSKEGGGGYLETQFKYSLVVLQSFGSYKSKPKINIRKSGENGKSLHIRSKSLTSLV